MRNTVFELREDQRDKHIDTFIFKVWVRRERRWERGLERGNLNKKNERVGDRETES